MLSGTEVIVLVPRIQGCGATMLPHYPHLLIRNKHPLVLVYGVES